MTRWNDVLAYAKNGNPSAPRRVEKANAQWRAQLSQDVFHVTREHGTERPFSSEMCAVFTPGRYACACCDELLFDANAKFDSGTGWPSFTQPVAENVIAYTADMSHGMVRVEVTCNVCDAHLGHVFADGPTEQGQSGLRYCINALSLTKRSG